MEFIHFVLHSQLIQTLSNENLFLHGLPFLAMFSFSLYVMRTLRRSFWADKHKTQSGFLFFILYMVNFFLFTYASYMF